MLNIKNKTVSNLYKYIEPNLNLVFQSLALSILVSLLEVGSTALVLPLTQVLGQGGIKINVQSFGVLTQLIELVNLFPQERQLVIILIALFCLTIFKNLCIYLWNVTINDFMIKCGNLLRQKCIERFLELDIAYYTKTSFGELFSYTNEQIPLSQKLFSLLLQMCQGVLIIGFQLGLMILLSPFLTIITLVCLTIVFLSFQFVIVAVHRHSLKFSTIVEDFSSLIAEIVHGMRVVKSFNAESRELERSKQALQERYQAELKIYKLHSTVAPLTETLGITVLLSILLIGTSLHATLGNSTFPILLTFTLALLRTLPRINYLNSVRSEFFTLLGNFEAVQSFLSRTSGISLRDGQYQYRGFRSELVFENLTFTFASNSEPTLRNINFRVKKGTVTAIVGSSGSGKSTLVDLVMRFYDPDSGRITIDGLDLRDLQMGSWRRAIAMVSQDTFLFNTSIRENILYGNPQASEVELREAAERAYAYEFIQDLPQGFHTIVGNRGTRLSGGQRQRLAIARAILCNPELLILDEATSALDSKSERIVQQAFEEVSRERTVLVIAHRLSTIEKADRIIVLQNGELVEQGTHRELLARREAYYSLYQSQAFSDSPVSQMGTHS